jgi:hypothetical protein
MLLGWVVVNQSSLKRSLKESNAPTGGQLMTKQITLEEALKLVSFYQLSGGSWRVLEVNGYIKGSVNGNVYGDVNGYINGNVNGNVNGYVLGNVDGNVDGNVNGDVIGYVNGNVNGYVDGNVNGDVNGYVDGNVNGDVDGNVNGDVLGNVLGTINGREWKFVERPNDKLQRLITESGNQELINTFNQMEDN